MVNDAGQHVPAYTYYLHDLSGTMAECQTGQPNDTSLQWHLGPRTCTSTWRPNDSLAMKGRPKI